MQGACVQGHLGPTQPQLRERCYQQVDQSGQCYLPHNPHLQHRPGAQHTRQPRVLSAADGGRPLLIKL